MPFEGFPFPLQLTYSHFFFATWSITSCGFALACLGARACLSRKCRICKRQRASSINSLDEVEEVRMWQGDQQSLSLERPPVARKPTCRSLQIFLAFFSVFIVFLMWGVVSLIAINGSWIGWMLGLSFVWAAGVCIAQCNYFSPFTRSLKELLPLASWAFLGIFVLQLSMWNRVSWYVATILLAIPIGLGIFPILGEVYVRKLVSRTRPGEYLAVDGVGVSADVNISSDLDNSMSWPRKRRSCSNLLDGSLISRTQSYKSESPSTFSRSLPIRRISNTTATSDVDKPLCAYWQDSAVYFCGVLGFLHKKKRVFFYSLLLFLVGLAGFFSFATEGVCVTFFNEKNPEAGLSVRAFSISSRFSRSFYPDACPPGPPCHVYFSVAEDMSSSIFVNAHYSSETPPMPVRWKPLGADAWEGEKPLEKFAVPGLDAQGSRAVQSALLTNLSATGAYAVQIGGKEAKIYKFKTGPSQTDESSFKFISGGDSGNTLQAEKISSQAGKRNALFGVVGGDLAYDNGLRTCYGTWDTWLSMWTERTTTADGFSLPLLAVLGNHDAGSNAGEGAFREAWGLKGGWSAQLSHIPLFFFFFPHHSSDSGDVPSVQQRKPYHAHRVGGSSIILALDSGYVADYSDQVDFISSTLSGFRQAHKGDSSFISAVYHVPFYAYPLGNMLQPGAIEGKPIWTPLFDQYGVSVAFENHVHAFKRTHPLVADKKHANGTIYLGDGYWGIEPHNPVSGANEGPLVYGSAGGSDNYVVSGLRYHAWSVEVSPKNGTASLQAFGLDGSVFDESLVTLRAEYM